LDLLDGAGTDAALLDQLLDARVADADHSEFRGYKKGIGRHQQDHKDHPQQHQTNHGVQ